MMNSSEGKGVLGSELLWIGGLGSKGLCDEQHWARPAWLTETWQQSSS